MKQIPTRELKSILNYDPDTGLFTNKQQRGTRSAPRGIVGYFAGSGYLNLKHNSRHYRLHRVAWSFVYGDIPHGALIDHINGDKADNRISNLRLASNSQNQMNLKKLKDRPLPRGVYMSRKGDRYRAMIMLNKKQHYLGTFDTKHAAATAYDAAAKKLFGGFA